MNKIEEEIKKKEAKLNGEVKFSEQIKQQRNLNRQDWKGVGKLESRV